MTRDLPNKRLIDGVQHCMVEDHGYQAVYEPCPQFTGAAVLGVSTVALAVLAWVVWLNPLVTQYRNAIDSVVNQAYRSLD